MKEYTRKPRLSRETINRLMNDETVTKGIYEYSVDRTWNEKLQRFDEALLRWNNAIGEYECWILGPEGLYEFELERK